MSFAQFNGDVANSQIPTAAAAAQAQAAAVAAAQQHRQPSFDVSSATTMQSQNNPAQVSSMTSPPLQGHMSPRLQMAVQSPAGPQTQTAKQQVPNQMSPSGQMRTPPHSQGKTPPRESGKNLGNVTAQEHSPASQGDLSNSSGYVSATESKPALQSQMSIIKTEPATPPPPPSQPQGGQIKVCTNYS